VAAAVQGRECLGLDERPKPTHPMLLLYYGLRNWSPPDGPLIFPEGGSWAEQDAEIMLALEVIQQLWAQETQSLAIQGDAFAQRES
jgi:hypothetical protein